MTKASEAHKLVTIQWLRAVAAIMVVVHHALFFTDSMQSVPVDTERELFGFSSWWFGVHLFFLVSGFIMIKTASGFGEAGAWRIFLTRRLLRVVPLYWLVMTPMVVAVIVWPHLLEIQGSKFQYILSSYLFIPSPRVEGDLRPILGQGWTLNYEMFFYAAFAVAMLLPRRTAILAMTIGFVSLVFFGRNLTASSPALSTWTDGIILEFLFGVYVGFAHQNGWRLSRWTACTVVAAGVWLIVLDFHQLPVFIFAGIPATLILCGTVLGPQPGDSRFSRALAGIGDASYSLYLTHVLVLRCVNSLWRAEVADRLPPIAFLIVAISASIIVSLIVYRLIESSMTLFLQRRLLGTSTAKRPQEADNRGAASTLPGEVGKENEGRAADDRARRGRPAYALWAQLFWLPSRNDRASNF
jgi:exopolysaccharide production protein ExoZ